MSLFRIGVTSVEYKEKIKRHLFTASNVLIGSIKSAMARMSWFVVTASTKSIVNCL